MKIIMPHYSNHNIRNYTKIEALRDLRISFIHPTYILNSLLSKYISSEISDWFILRINR